MYALTLLSNEDGEVLLPGEDLPPLDAPEDDIDSEEAASASDMLLATMEFTRVNSRLSRLLHYGDQFTFSVNSLMRAKETVDQFGYTPCLNSFLNSDGDLAVALGLNADQEMTLEVFNESFGDAVSRIWDLITGFVTEIIEGLKTFFKSFFNFQEKVDKDVKLKLDVIKKADQKEVDQVMAIQSHKGFVHYRDFDKAIQGLVRVMTDLNNLDIKEFQKYVDDVIAGKNPAGIDLISAKYLGSDYEKRLLDLGIRLRDGGSKTDYSSLFLKATTERKLKDLGYNQASLEVIDQACGVQLRGATDRLQRLIPELEGLRKQLLQHKASNKTSDDSIRKLLATIPEQIMAFVGLARRCVVVAGEYQAKRQELIDAVYLAVTDKPAPSAA